VRILALDVGDRRIGVAVTQSGRLATPTAVIERTSKRDDFARIARLIREHGAELLVVGRPLNDDGSSGPQALRIERYTEALMEALRAEGISLSLAYFDEHLSTHHAQEALIEAGRGTRSRRARLDAVAAAVILEEYLSHGQIQNPATAQEESN